MTWELEHIHGNPEHNLFDCAIQEFTDISGFSVDYYVYDQTITKDKLYGESSGGFEYFHSPIRTKMVYEVTEEGKSYRTFGMFPMDVLQYLYIPKSSFKRDIIEGLKKNNITLLIEEPQIGDLIQTLWNNQTYQIVDIGLEDKIFQAKKLVYEFILKPYEFSDQSVSASNILTTDPFDVGESITISTSAGSTPLSGASYSDSDWIQRQSNQMDAYSEDDVDKDFYGYE